MSKTATAIMRLSRWRKGGFLPVKVLPFPANRLGCSAIVRFSVIVPPRPASMLGAGTGGSIHPDLFRPIHGHAPAFSGFPACRARFSVSTRCAATAFDRNRLCPQPTRRVARLTALQLVAPPHRGAPPPSSSIASVVCVFCPLSRVRAREGAKTQTRGAAEQPVSPSSPPVDLIFRPSPLLLELVFPLG